MSRCAKFPSLVAVHQRSLCKNWQIGLLFLAPEGLQLIDSELTKIYSIHPRESLCFSRSRGDLQNLPKLCQHQLASLSVGAVPLVKRLSAKIRAKARILWDGDGTAYATLAEAARELGLSLRTANSYCHRGILEGARFERGRWLIPCPIKRPLGCTKMNKTPVIS